MFLHLFATSDESEPAPSTLRPTSLRLLCGYESGSVILRRYTRTDRPISIEGQGWEVVWTSKSHVETSRHSLHECLFASLFISFLPVMSMAVSRDKTFALSVSADHLVVKYEISVGSSVCENTASHHPREEL